MTIPLSPMSRDRKSARGDEPCCAGRALLEEVKMSGSSTTTMKALCVHSYGDPIDVLHVDIVFASRPRARGRFAFASMPAPSIPPMGDLPGIQLRPAATRAGSGSMCRALLMPSAMASQVSALAILFFSVPDYIGYPDRGGIGICSPQTMDSGPGQFGPFARRMPADGCRDSDAGASVCFRTVQGPDHHDQWWRDDDRGSPPSRLPPCRVGECDHHGFSPPYPLSFPERPSRVAAA